MASISFTGVSRLWGSDAPSPKVLRNRLEKLRTMIIQTNFATAKKAKSPASKKTNGLATPSSSPQTPSKRPIEDTFPKSSARQLPKRAATMRARSTYSYFESDSELSDIESSLFVRVPSNGEESEDDTWKPEGSQEEKMEEGDVIVLDDGKERGSAPGSSVLMEGDINSTVENDGKRVLGSPFSSIGRNEAESEFEMLLHQD